MYIQFSDEIIKVSTGVDGRMCGFVILRSPFAIDPMVNVWLGFANNVLLRRIENIKTDSDEVVPIKFSVIDPDSLKVMRELSIHPNNPSARRNRIVQFTSEKQLGILEQDDDGK